MVEVKVYFTPLENCKQTLGNNMKFNDLLIEKKQYRYTLYDYKNGRPTFKEYMNDDELSPIMNSDKIRKLPSIIVVRNDGNWIHYDMVENEHGVEAWTKARKGKRADLPKLKLNKEPDLDSI